MSEFKVGDKVVAISNELNGRIRVVKEIIDGKYLVFKHDGFHKNLFRKAESAEEEAGHRIDMPTLPEPVGSLQELHPEFAKVLHENFLELLGDDFPIENHISPNCQSRDV